MTDGFLTHHLRRTSRNALIAAAILLAAAAATIGLSYRYLRNVVSAPVPMDKDAVQRVSDPTKLDRYHVVVSADDNVDTGFEYTSRSSRSGTVTEHSVYRALMLDDHLLLAKAPANDPKNSAAEMTGWLVPVPGDVQKEVLDKIVKEVPDTEGRFLPMMLDATGDNFPAVLLSLLILALAGLGVFALLRWLRSRNPATHPLTQELARYGDVDQQVSQLESEVPPGSKASKLVTPHWVLSLTQYGGAIRRLDDIAWAYRHTLTRKSYGVTVGKTESVKLHDRAGKEVTAEFAKDAAGADQFLRQVIDHAPWVIAGHNAEIESLWKKKRADFLATVDERKRQRGAPSK